MNCDDFTRQLDDYLDADPAADLAALQQHVEACAHCQQSLDEARAIRAALAELPVEAPSRGFEQRVLAEVRRQHKDTHKHHFIAGFGTAMAASLALWFASNLFIPGTGTQPTESISVAMHSVSTVKLMFEVPDALADVTLSVKLPANVELQGYPGQQQLSWKTSLKKGQNVLALPVLAIESGSGEMVAQLTYGNKTKSLRIVLKSTDNGAYQYQLLPMESV